MPHTPVTTAGGNGYLGSAGTFAQFFEGFKWIAENRDSLDANMKLAWEQLVSTEAGRLDGEIAKLKAQPIPTSTDLNEMRGGDWTNSLWSISSQARLDTLINKPSWMTSGDVMQILPGIGFQIVYKYTSGGTPEIWYRARTSSSTPNVWSEWGKVYPVEIPKTDQKFTSGFAAHGHKVRQDFLLRRLGGVVGTSGKAAVALRFDDNPRKFLDVVLPLLRKYQLPGYIASAVRYYDETAAPYTEVEQAAIQDGVEIANHSQTHADATGDQAIYDNTVAAADFLESQMPNVTVDTWTMPSLGGTKMDGYDDGRNVSDFIDTTAGRVIMSRHAVVNGYAGGRTQPLIGSPTVGQTHLTIEGMTLADVQTYVGEAQRMGTGLTLMLHPSRIDTAGYMTTAVFESVLAWLDAERQAGRLVCLSAQAIAFADSGKSQRVNFCPNGDFSQGVSGWQNNTGWTFDSVAGTATTSTGTPLYQNVLISPFLSSRGQTFEMVYRVKGTAGDVVRTTAYSSGGVLNSTKDHTLADSNWVEVRKLFTIPKGLAFDTLIKFEIGRVSGGTVTVRDVRIRAN